MPPKLLDRLRAEIRRRNYSPRTAETYAHWARRFILFHGKRHPAELGAPEIAGFLTALAVRDRVSASTQNQALAALLFLYREVLELDVAELDELVRAKHSQRLPVVLTPAEVRSVLGRLAAPHQLRASLMYGSGLRLLECCSLRVKDLDLTRRELIVRDGKGGRDRITMIPAVLLTPLREQLERTRAQHERDLQDGAGWVDLPDAYARKSPTAGSSWPWQWLVPARRTYTHPLTGQRRRHFLHETTTQRAVRQAVRDAGLPTRSGTIRKHFQRRHFVRLDR